MMIEEEPWEDEPQEFEEWEDDQNEEEDLPWLEDW